ncbi:MAG: ABC transporter ATP-binding protein [Thermaerobacter sp.]|nr:ABC transporter ATP-binding protein [Thermaerobacter sp.]
MVIAYLIELATRIGRAKVVFYIFLLLIIYTLFSLQPYFVSELLKDNSQWNVMYFLFTFLSFLSVSLVNYPNNYFLQSIRQHSKSIVWADNKNRPYVYFINKEIGDIQNLIGEISFSSRSIQYVSLQVLVKAITIVTVYTYLLFAQNIILSIYYLFFYTLYFCISYFLSKNNSKCIESALKSSSKINSYMIDYHKNIENIISNKSFDQEEELFASLLAQEKNAYYILQKKIDNSHLVQQFVIATLTSIALFINYRTSAGDSWDVKVIMILVYSMFNLSHIGKEFLALLEHKDRLSMSLQRLEFDKARYVSNIKVDVNQKHAITVKNVDFSIQGSDILRDITLSIESGSKIAIVGKNGSGKSTLVKIMAGIMEPDRGRIIWNCAECTYVSQSSTLFDRTIYENMIYPKRHYPKEELMLLVNELNLDSLIKSEIDLVTKTPGDFGSKFSGGEKQKVLIIRAIVNKAPIMFFDEIDSSIDQDTEKKFNMLIKRHFSENTVICVTHKGNNLDVYDKVFDIEAKALR